MRAGVAWLLFAVGCDRVLGLQPPVLTDGRETFAPIQDVTGGIASGMSVMEFSFPVAPTRAGDTLVAIASLYTVTEHISAITDDGNNVWMRGVDGADACGTCTPPGDVRFEIWYVLGAHPVAATVTVSFDTIADQRPTAVEFLEWDPIAPAGTPVASLATPTGALANGGSAGPLDVPGRAVAFAVIAAYETGTVTLDSSAYVPLRSPLIDGYRALGAYANVDVGPLTATWTFDQSTSWTAGLFAIPVSAQ